MLRVVTWACRPQIQKERIITNAISLLGDCTVTVLTSLRGRNDRLVPAKASHVLPLRGVIGSTRICQPNEPWSAVHLVPDNGFS